MEFVAKCLDTFNSCSASVIEQTVKADGKFTEDGFRREFKISFPILYANITKNEKFN